MSAETHSLLGSIQHFPIDFATPQALWLLLFLPVWWLLRAMRKPPTITFSRADLIARGPRSGSIYPTFLFLLHNLMVIALVVTIARPRLAKPESKINSEGINIALAVDLSSSMLAQDFVPKNRLEVAKENLRRFILARGSDQIGLVAFASEAMTQVPLTTDYPVLLQAVDNLRIGQLDDGTAIGDAVATAANRLRTAPGKSRVMIVMTDGQNNRGTVDPLTAARAALTYGIRIYTIGIGTRGMAPFPQVGPDGKQHLVMQKVDVDDTLLTKMAEMSGGQYFRATDAETLKDIYGQIDKLEKTKITAKAPMHYAELFRWSLGSAIVLLLLEMAVAAVRAPLP